MNWRHFTMKEFACKHCGKNLIEEAFVAKLDDLRDRCGFPLVVTSGYRCPDHNAKVSSTGRTGPHTTGRAADLRVDRQRAYELTKLAMELGFTGIGFQQKGGGRFIHLDDLTEGRPTVWSY